MKTKLTVNKGYERTWFVWGKNYCVLLDVIKHRGKGGELY